MLPLGFDVLQSAMLWIIQAMAVVEPGLERSWIASDNKLRWNHSGEVRSRIAVERLANGCDAEVFHVRACL